jgi:hypothetical protein
MGNFAHHALLLSEKQTRSLLVNVIAGLFQCGVKIKFKTKENKPQGWLNRLISVVLFFNKDYLTRYTTVIGKTIWFPSEEHYRDLYDNRPASLLATLLHERRHFEQSEENNGCSLFVVSLSANSCLGCSGSTSEFVVFIFINILAATS